MRSISASMLDTTTSGCDSAGRAAAGETGSRCARSARVVLLLLLGIFLLASHSRGQVISSDRVCYGGCEYSSLRRLNWCTFTNGMGGGVAVNDADPAKVYNGLRDACGAYESAHTDINKTTQWVGSCTPDTSVDWFRSGGNAASFRVNGRIRITYHPGGGPITHAEEVAGDWWLGQCGCEDALNISFARVGVTGQCHCPDGMLYSPNRGACFRYLDRYWDTDTCPVQVGNPVVPLTGAKRQTFDLFPMVGESLRLGHDSSAKLPADNPHAVLMVFGAMAAGPLWTTSLHRKLFVRAGSVGSVLASRGLGRWVSFVQTPGGDFMPTDAATTDRLVRIAGAAGWRYHDERAGAIERYDPAGQLMAIDYLDGGRLALEYSTSLTPPDIAPAPGLLIQVVDHRGRRVAMTYEERAGAGASAVLKTIRAPDGGLIVLGYDARSNLDRVQWQDGTAVRLLYESPEHHWALTGMIDEVGQRAATYSYDSAGRAVHTESAGGVERYTIGWAAAPVWQIVETLDPAAGVIWRDHVRSTPSGTTITTPRGAVMSLEAAAVQGAPRLAAQTQPAGAGCAASVRRQTHDVSGNVTSRDDFNGVRTCYGYEPLRNLERFRIEGLDGTATCGDLAAEGAALPGPARRVSTLWHADRRLRIASAEPGRITRWIYNGEPDPYAGGVIAACVAAGADLPDGRPLPALCKRVEEETNDANGSLGFGAALAGTAARVTSYTYDRYGRVLTQRDAAGAVTTYAYHPETNADVTMGDLATVTNAAGHVTQYPRYDRSGRPLLEIGPNGLRTIYAYDARGRVTRVDTGGAVMLYHHLPNGPLHRVDAPDGSWLQFEHDAARRLVAVSNHLGHRIDYALDAAGNRIGESVRDEAGTMRRTIARSIDALDRVQQVIGRSR